MLKKDKLPSVSIILPVFNEEKLFASSVRKIIAQAVKMKVAYEILIVENGSTDLTALIADSLCKANKKIKVLHLPEANYGKALRLGYTRAKNRILVNLSADWTDMSFVQHSLRKIRNYDIITVGKYQKGSLDQRPFIRRLGGLMFHKMVEILFGLPLSDTHGHRIIKRVKIVPIIKKCCLFGEGFETELIIRSHQAKRAICEIPSPPIKEQRPPRISIFKRAFQGISQLFLLRLILFWENNTHPPSSNI